MIAPGTKPHHFYLSDTFKQKLKGLPEQWGFGGLSAFTFYRTYSRKKENGTMETWADCVIRVIEGMFTILKTHAKLSHIPWDNKKAAKHAEEAAIRMFEFKWLPPGRGLWMMGTPFIWEKGGACLNNPLHIDTEILTKEYGWISLKDIPTKEVTVLSNSKDYSSANSTAAAPVWTKATVSHIEQHPSYELTIKTKFGNETNIISSENHRWFRKKSTKHAFERVTTDQLKEGNWLPVNKPRLQLDLSLIGFAHGFFFGDGTRSSGELHQFTSEDKDILNTLFTDHYKRVSNRVLNSGLTEMVIKNLPTAWANLPEGNYLEDKRYVYSFLSGYFAADGSITDYCISSAREEELNKIKKLFNNLGIETSEVFLSSTSSNYKDDRKLYKLRLNRYDLPTNFFMKKSQKEAHSTLSYPKYQHAVITKIKKLNNLYPVMCVTVPEYENFTTKGFVLTSNCAFVSTENIESELSKPFAFLMDMSMVGVGVGFDTKGADRVPVVIPTDEPETIVVDDSREGWVEAISCLIDSYLEPNSRPVEINTSLVRPYGDPIAGFGGVASGPEPLEQGFYGIRDVLEKRAMSEDNLLSSTDIVDIMNLIGKIVVAGNVRRTAEIAFAEPDDQEFIEMKRWDKFGVETGSIAPPELLALSKDEYDRYNSDWNARGEIAKKYANYEWAYKFGGWRWASNNSLFAYVGMDYTDAAKSIALNGEPGFAWLDNMQKYGRMKDGINNKDYRVRGGNPCLEQSLEPYELCCLVENFPAKHKDYWDFQRTLKFSYMYAKTVTLVATHWAETNAVITRNRRIGCSQSGIQTAMLKFGRHKYFDQFCDRAYTYIQYVDQKYAEWLGVPKSIKTTSVKPSGTVSLVAGELPGIHYAENESYFRTVRVAANSPFVPLLKEAGYKIEPAVSDPTRTVVVYFPVLLLEGTISNKNISIWEQFANAVDMQHYWADNQVSITITFNNTESSQIARALSAFDNRLKGVSLLPVSDHGYAQAPYTSAPRDEVEAYAKTLKPINFDSLTKEGDNADANKFCDGDACLI